MEAEAEQFSQFAFAVVSDCLMATQIADALGQLGRSDQLLHCIEQSNGEHFEQLEGQQSHDSATDHRPQGFELNQLCLRQSLGDWHHPQQPPGGEE